MATMPEPPPSPTDVPDDAGTGDIQFPEAAPPSPPPPPDAPEDAGEVKLPEGGADTPAPDVLDVMFAPAAPPDPTKAKTYYDLIKSLNVAIAQLVIYPDRHPRVRQLLEETLALLTGFLAHADQLTFGLTEGKLFIAGELMEEHEPGVLRFIDFFKKLEVDDLTFLPDLTLPELVALVKVMGLKSERIEALGGLRTLLSGDALPHVRLEKVRYERILDGQTIVSASQAEQAAAAVDGAAQPSTEHVKQLQQEVARQRAAQAAKSPFQVLTEYLEGKIDDFPEAFDVKGLVSEMHKNPKRVVALMLQAGRAIQSLQTVVERVGRWLAAWAQTEGFRSRINPSEVMAELGRTMQQEMLNPEVGDLAAQVGLMESLGAMVSHFSDVIKTNLVVAKYHASRKKPAEVAKFVGTVMADETERDRLLPEIAKQLKEAGLSDEELNRLIGKVKETQVGEGTVKISRTELQRLYKLEQQAKQRPAAGAPASAAPVARAEVERIFARLGERPLKTAARPDAKVELTEAEADQLRAKAEKLDWLLDRKEKINLAGLVEAHRTVAQQLDQLNTLVHELSQGVVIVDPRDQVVLMNRAAEDLLGVRMDRMIGRHILERLREEQVVALGRRTPGAGGGEATIRQLDMAQAVPGRQTIKASTAVVEDLQGRTVGMLFVLSDLQKEQELERLKDHFLGRLKQELRAPLTALHDALVLILGGTAGDLTEDQRRLATQAVEHTARLTHHVDTLLDFTKFQRGEVKPQRRPVPLESLMQRVLGVFQPWAQQKQLALQYLPPEQPMTVMADADLCDRLLCALVANAVNFTPEKGRVTMVAEWAKNPAGGAPVAAQVNVRDTGPGITKRDLATIFEPFNAATGAGAGGTGLGLGLALAKSIVQQHGGQIWAESELGAGSVFSFTLPLAADAPVPPKK